MVDDDKDAQDESVASLFSSNGADATLTALLSSTSISSVADDHDDEEERFVICGGGSGGDDRDGHGEWLVRTAMRSRERELSDVEEKWVSYSEVVEKRESEEVEEVMSRCVEGVWGMKRTRGGSSYLLSLKLDYEGILNAWSDKAPLFYAQDGDRSPQTVPDLLDHHDHDFDLDLHHDHHLLLSHDCSPLAGQRNGWGNGENIWRVPEYMENIWRVPEIGPMKMKTEEKEEELGGEQELKIAQRQASLLRYKEKRQSRLFSKRIRYQVRKLNAEKRPRIKGRFVKRN